MSRASRARSPVLRTLDIGCRTGSGEGMNDPEVTMSNALANTNLIAHDKALAAAGMPLHSSCGCRRRSSRLPIR